MTPDRSEIDRLSKEFENAPPGQVLRWAWDTMGSRVAMSTAFGSSGMVLLDIARKQVPDMAIFTIDTGYLFPETLELKARVEAHYGFTIEVIHPEQSVSEQNRHYGEALYGRDPDRCCAMRKVEPLRRKLAQLDGWIASLRRDQSETRKDVQPLESYWFDDGRMIVKANPLANWTRKQVWDYILEHEVPYNPLLDQGYASIGCWPCTQAVSGSNERDGRWAGTAKTECGIHTSFVRVEDSVSESDSAVPSD
ncbi:MAG: phosphoadenylyl-sulfate reductase [bacterium]|nr:phosphoadenylyl-sulfate reductase [bacterium]